MMRRTGLVLGLLVALVILPTRLMAQSLDELWQSGNAAQSSGNYEDAERIWRRIIQIQSSDAAVYNSLGLSLYKQNRLEDAKIAYDQAIRLNSQYSDAYKGRGDVLYLQKKLPEALSDYDQAILLDKKYADAYIGRGNTLKDQGKFEKAQEKFKKAIADYQEAIRLYEELKLIRTYNQQGEVIYEEGSQLTSHSKVYLALAYNSLGEIHSLQGDLEEGIEDYNCAIKLNYQYAEAYNNLGLALYQKDDLLGAINAYENSIKSNPKFIYAYNNLALTLYQQSHREKEAQQREKLITKAIKNYQTALSLPDNTSEKPTAHTWAHNGLGWIYQQQQNLADALAEYESALKIDPKFEYAKNNRDQVLALLKQPTELAYNDTRYLQPTDPLTRPKRAVVLLTPLFPQGRNQQGTGFIIKRTDNKLWILTNRHILTDSFYSDPPRPCDSVEVQIYPGDKPNNVRIAVLTSKTILIANNLDLALIELEAPQLPTDIQALPISDPSDNQPITTIGHPDKNPWQKDQGKVIDVDNETLRLKISLDVGSSGSPVMTENYGVIGIIYKIDQEGTGYAIPINQIRQQLATWRVQLP